MANLVYPQLSNGAQVQYPIRKRRIIQSPANAFADGSMITSNINANTQFVWELAYSGLTIGDQSALQDHFTTCQGALLPFIFIDPTGNMLRYSGDLTLSAWQADSLLRVTGGAIDPTGGNNAFTIVNSGQTDQKLSQQIYAPANFRYCFSVFASAAVPSSVSLGSSAVSEQSKAFSVGSNWARLANSSQLPDDQLHLTVSIIIPAAQTVVIYGPQLEPQLSPSRYRATAAIGGVHSDGHFLGDSLTFESVAPGLFSTLISIETT